MFTGVENKDLQWEAKIMKRKQFSLQLLSRAVQ
jgi:hypothetical protein